MKRTPTKASNKYQAYFELTKPSITFMILISTALGYYLGSDGIIDFKKLTFFHREVFFHFVRKVPRVVT